MKCRIAVSNFAPVLIFDQDADTKSHDYLTIALLKAKRNHNQILNEECLFCEGNYGEKFCGPEIVRINIFHAV